METQKGKQEMGIYEDHRSICFTSGFDDFMSISCPFLCHLGLQAVPQHNLEQEDLRKTRVMHQFLRHFLPQRVWSARGWFAVQNFASLSASICHSNLCQTSLRVELKRRPLSFYELHEAVCKTLQMSACSGFLMCFGSASFVYIMKHKGSIFIACHVTWDWVQPPWHNRTGISKVVFPCLFSFRPLQAQLRDPWSRAPACCNLAGQLIWLI